MRGWSAERLAAEVTASGYPLSRSSVATAERNHRAGMSVDQLVATARALGTSPVNLLACGPCPTCHGTPPAGFTCGDCGAAGSVRPTRMRGWVERAVRDTDALFDRCSRDGASLDDIRILRDLVHDVADEVVRLQQVVRTKDFRLAERHSRIHTRGAAS
ncbi:hypothetical protein B4N89_27305 [Embleya scabrispora]|uniref:Uncharacterized protein n=2 Tax=Embleya scabrispora TaxID=159449 RepID=A0A1T3P4W8_9ACTN|nr:hypothetical protein B4N89_27305 [Embleya scabrispora]